MPTVNDVLDLIDSDVAGTFGLIHRIVWNGAMSSDVPEELLEGLTGSEAVALSNLILLGENANSSNSATWSITVSYRVARLYLWYLNVVVARTDPSDDRLLKFVNESYEALIHQIGKKYESPRGQFGRNQIGYRFTDRNDTVRVTVVVGMILNNYDLKRYEKTLREIAADHRFNNFRVEAELLGVRAFHVGVI